MKYPVSDLSAQLHDGKFADANPATGTPASIDKAAHMNAVYDELINLIVAGGLTPNEAQFNQVSLAVAALIANAIAGVRGGVSTALDTLIEIAASLGYDAHFSTTMANALANKSDTSHSHSASALGFSWGEGWIKFPTGQQICAAQVLANIGEGVFTAYYPRAFAAPPIVIPVVINQAGIYSGGVECHAQIINTYTGYCTTFIQWSGSNSTAYAGIMYIAFGWGA